MMLKIIHAAEDHEAAWAKAEAVIAKPEPMRLPRAAQIVREAETLTYYRFPNEHWRRIRTHNPLERIMREIRRRTRVSRRPLGADAMRRTPAPHRGHEVGHAPLSRSIRHA